jgi:hypothetical protein
MLIAKSRRRTCGAGAAAGSRNTIYKCVPELKGGRVAVTEATAAVELPRPA